MDLNGLLSFWLCFYFLERVFNSQSIDRESHLFQVACIVIFIVCLLNWPMIRGSACSANYDFVSTCCIIVLSLIYMTI